MKPILKYAFALIFMTLFASCQSKTDPKAVLLDKDSREEVIYTIANNNEMMKQMMEEIANSNNAKMMVQQDEKMNMMLMEDRSTMKKIMKNNPAMMQFIMSDIMETCKGDSSMTAGVCKTMMGNQPMMDMMMQMKGGKKK